MKLEQSFEVAAPIDEVWAALIDVERVAPCLPGAQITEAGEDGTYRDCEHGDDDDRDDEDQDDVHGSSSSSGPPSGYPLEPEYERRVSRAP